MNSERFIKWKYILQYPFQTKMYSLMFAQIAVDTVGIQ